MSKAKKFRNDPKMISREILTGFLSANVGQLHRVGTGNVIMVNDIKKGKVGILVGGGGCGEPFCIGYVGKNMADGAAYGNMNAAPSPYLILEGIKGINQGKGVLLIYNNYPGDNLNFGMAMEFAEQEKIQTKSVRVCDCVTNGSTDNFDERGGAAGVIFVIKVAGGACNEIDNLEEVYRITTSARDNSRTIIVAANSGSYLENGELVFALPEDEIKIGTGFHGEPGLVNCKMMSANDTVDLVLDKLLADLNCESGDEVAIIVNSMGATSFAELCIVNNRIKDVLLNKSINIHHIDIGFYFPINDMVGFSISLLRLNDEIKKYFDFPANSYSYRR